MSGCRYISGIGQPSGLSCPMTEPPTVHVSAPTSDARPPHVKASMSTDGLVGLRSRPTLGSEPPLTNPSSPWSVASRECVGEMANEA
jgi:hypothetical protein